MLGALCTVTSGDLGKKMILGGVSWDTHKFCFNHLVPGRNMALIPILGGVRGEGGSL